MADGIAGNDIVVRHDGSVYVTHPGGGPNPSLVWHIAPKARRKSWTRG